MDKNQQVVKIKDAIIVNDSGFAGIILWCPHCIVDKDTIAYTNGTSIFVGNKFFYLTEKEQAGVIIHEVLHIAFCHISRGKALNIPNLIWNLATDAVINYGILQTSWVKLPDGCVHLEDLIDPVDLRNTPKNKWTAEMVADYLMRNRVEYVSPGSGSGDENGENGEGQDSSNSGKGNADDASSLGAPKGWTPDLKPNEKADNVPEYIEESLKDPDYIQQSNWADRLEKSVKAGTSSASILKRLEQEFPKSETPWFHYLRRLMKTPLLAERTTNWSRCSRRMMSTFSRVFDPSTKQKDGIKKAAVIIDTSGSIYSCPTLLNQFVSEVDAIQRTTGATIILVYADCEVQAVHECKSDGSSFIDKVKKEHFPVVGGGGTDFRPALKLLEEKYNISVAVYLTDMYGSFPEKNPTFPVIWAATEDEEAPEGIGTTIRLKL